MLAEKIMLVIGLLFVVSLLSVLSDKLNISYPIILVIAGLIISIIPGVPRVRLDPELIFIIFLPPLLYAAAWSTSWPDFWKARRPIGFLAFGLVLFTSTIVAVVCNMLIPDFGLALGFLLGGIISPPDAVAATSVTKGLRLPRPIVTILEGESLVNDASSLIIFRFALAAFFTGSFSIYKAEIDFFTVSIMGVLIGLAVAHVVYAVHRFLPTSPSVDTAITLISPYFAYIVCEHYHFSGVLAVVSAGLFISWRSSDIFSFQTRMQTVAVWDTLVFILNGLVFILIGLQLPEIIENLSPYSLKEAIGYGMLISLLVIVIRILWVFPSNRIPRLLSKRIREREPRASWREILLIGWSGMRGVVSLAAALSLPLALSDGSTFHQRNLILFITFCVIQITLIVQGLTLPAVIRLLKIRNEEDELEQEKLMRLEMAYATIEYIESSLSNADVTQDALSHIKAKYERRINRANRQMLNTVNEYSTDLFQEFNQLQLSLIGFERKELIRIRRQKKFSDELVRKIENELDYEEAGLKITVQMH